MPFLKIRLYNFENDYSRGKYIKKDRQRNCILKCDDKMTKVLVENLTNHSQRHPTIIDVTDNNLRLSTS